MLARVSGILEVKASKQASEVNVATISIPISILRLFHSLNAKFDSLLIRFGDQRELLAANRRLHQYYCCFGLLWSASITAGKPQLPPHKAATTNCLPVSLLAHLALIASPSALLFPFNLGASLSVCKRAFLSLSLSGLLFTLSALIHLFGQFDSLRILRNRIRNNKSNMRPLPLPLQLPL